MISKEGYEYIRELYAKGYRNPSMYSSLLLMKELATGKFMEIRKFVEKEMNRIDQEIKRNQNAKN